MTSLTSCSIVLQAILTPVALWKQKKKIKKISSRISSRARLYQARINRHRWTVICIRNRRNKERPMRCPCTETALRFCLPGTLLINANEYWARFLLI